MAEPKTCTYAVDIDENEHDVACGEPASFKCCGEFYCHQCAHDWLDTLEPGTTHHDVTCIARDLSDG